MKNRTLLYAVVIAGFAGMLAANFAVAHMGATGIVKQRMDAMSVIGKSMKQIGEMLRGKQAFDSNRAVVAAQTIASHGRAIPSLFPEGSGGGVSEAKETIWQNRAAFDREAASMVSAAEALAVTAATGDRAAVGARYKALAASCKNCHRDFRAKKKR